MLSPPPHTLFLCPPLFFFFSTHVPALPFSLHLLQLALSGFFCFFLLPPYTFFLISLSPPSFLSFSPSFKKCFLLFFFLQLLVSVFFFFLLLLDSRTAVVSILSVFHTIFHPLFSILPVIPPTKHSVNPFYTRISSLFSVTYLFLSFYIYLSPWFCILSYKT